MPAAKKTVTEDETKLLDNHGEEVATVGGAARATAATGRRGTMGVWIHYRKDGELILVQSLHAEKIDAATTALDAEITGKIDFIPWGSNIADVIK